LDLDDTSNTLETNSSKAQRRRTVAWPELEAALYDWQRLIEERGGITTTEILQSKTKIIWNQLPQYRGLPTPEFSYGWIVKFRQRHNILYQTLHGKAGSIGVTAEEQMKAIQTIAGVLEDNIYNMDETGLYWRMSPSKGFTTRSISGQKKDKARISVAICVNAAGTDRLPIWFIGKAKKPRALQHVDVGAMGGVWR
jgi:hypothetical protein